MFLDLDFQMIPVALLTEIKIYTFYSAKFSVIQRQAAITIYYMSDIYLTNTINSSYQKECHDDLYQPWAIQIFIQVIFKC